MLLGLGFSLLLCFPLMAKASFMQRRQSYKRPICQANETCFYEAYGFQFELCDCPGKDSSCPKTKSHGVFAQGVRYNFCSQPEIPTCEPGELSTIVKQLQTSLACICPDDMNIVPRKSMDQMYKEFTCEKRKVCETGESCATRGFAGTKQMCSCSGRQHCVFRRTDVPLLSPIKQAFCVEEENT